MSARDKHPYPPGMVYPENLFSAPLAAAWNGFVLFAWAFAITAGITIAWRLAA